MENPEVLAEMDHQDHKASKETEDLQGSLVHLEVREHLVLLDREDQGDPLEREENEVPLDPAVLGEDLVCLYHFINYLLSLCPFQIVCLMSRELKTIVLYQYFQCK